MLRKAKAEELFLRDPAAAALFGVLPGADFGADFGEDGMGADFGDEYGEDIGADDVGNEIAAEFGDEVGAAVATALKGRVRPPRPTSLARTTATPQAVAAWNKGQQVASRTLSRATLLDPNAGSTIKVEQYELPMSQAIVIGTALGLMPNLTATPDTVIKPKRLVCNAPMPGFVFIQDIKASNVSASISSGVTDAFNYNAMSIGTNVHLPRLTSSTRVSITAAYTGAIPPNVLGGTASFFTATFYGPCTLAGG
jgi:hypothetical protein